MGIGRAIALGGLGRGLQTAADDYTTARRVAAQEALAQQRDEEQRQRDNVTLMANVAREGGVIGNLPSGYNADGTVQSRFPMRPGSYVGQSTATTQTPYSSETNSYRPMKKIGTVGDKDVWVPADGMTPDAYERLQTRRAQLAEKEQGRQQRKAAVQQFKYTRPDAGLVAALDDPEQGDTAFQMLLKAEMEADPAYQQRQVQIAGARAQAQAEGRLPSQKELKDSPSAARQGGNGTNQEVTQRRIQLSQNQRGAMGMLKNEQVEQKAANKALGGLRNQYRNLGDDTTGVDAQQLKQQIGALQGDSAQHAQMSQLYGDRARAYADSMAMPNMGLQPANGAPPAPPVAQPQQSVDQSQQEAAEYANAAQQYKQALGNGHDPAQVQQAYEARVRQIAQKYHAVR